MKKELLALLRNTKAVTLSGGVVRTLDDAELASVVGGMMPSAARTSCSCGCADDCCQ